MANITHSHTGKRKRTTKLSTSLYLYSLCRPRTKNSVFVSFIHTYAHTLQTVSFFLFFFLYILNGIIFWTSCFVWILFLTLMHICVLEVLSLNFIMHWWSLLNREMSQNPDTFLFLTLMCGMWVGYQISYCQNSRSNWVFPHPVP